MPRLLNAKLFAEMCRNAFFAVCQHIPSQTLRRILFSFYLSSITGKFAAANVPWRMGEETWRHASMAKWWLSWHLTGCGGAVCTWIIHFQKDRYFQKGTSPIHPKWRRRNVGILTLHDYLSQLTEILHIDSLPCRHLQIWWNIEDKEQNFTLHKMYEGRGFLWGSSWNDCSLDTCKNKPLNLCQKISYCLM